VFSPNSLCLMHTSLLIASTRSSTLIQLLPKNLLYHFIRSIHSVPQVVNTPRLRTDEVTLSLTRIKHHFRPRSPSHSGRMSPSEQPLMLSTLGSNIRIECEAECPLGILRLSSNYPPDASFSITDDGFDLDASSTISSPPLQAHSLSGILSRRSTV